MADQVPFPAHHVPVSLDPHKLSTTCWCDPTLEWDNDHVVAVNHIDTDNGTEIDVGSLPKINVVPVNPNDIEVI